MRKIESHEEESERLRAAYRAVREASPLSALSVTLREVATGEDIMTEVTMSGVSPMPFTTGFTFWRGHTKEESIVYYEEMIRQKVDEEIHQMMKSFRERHVSDGIIV